MKKKAKYKHSHNLGQVIALIRKKRGYTQDQLAAMTGISQSTIAMIERGGNNPTVKTLEQLAAALDTSLATLFSTKEIFVFDMPRLKDRYKCIDDLSENLYMAIDKLLRFAKEIGF